MTLDDMIAVLEAARKGEKIETCNEIGQWVAVFPPVSFGKPMHCYRIAPKEPKLVPHYLPIYKNAHGYWRLGDCFYHEIPHKRNSEHFVRLATELPPIMLEVKE